MYMDKIYTLVLRAYLNVRLIALVTRKNASKTKRRSSPASVLRKAFIQTKILVVSLFYDHTAIVNLLSISNTRETATV